jgi:hypothetical protein
MIFFPNLNFKNTVILFFELLDDYEHVGVGVGDAVGNVDLVILLSCIDVECEVPAFYRSLINLKNTQSCNALQTESISLNK